ncbi:hypothetical protein PAXRUDRAFT_146705 [Paxillus rubicundulus Ve08.2h10]|uniref:Uncharacterized protein n=1 Tax=Paxillus rubicundulus Ve08.2h10 TaxID=930991 RepID=A0A0D0DZR4_9AGAM|nr:hypothetical protein PAXRUDRAFT_146705 [Paxillus rubicundulus Ve08.2h10]
MRRFTSVFVSSRRTDKPGPSSTTSSNEDTIPPRDPHTRKKKSTVFNSFPRKAASTIDSLPPLVSSNLATSSSSSSSGSTTLPTPVDDSLPRTLSKKGNWKSWLGGKKSPGNNDVEEIKHPSWQLTPPSEAVLRPPNADPFNQIDDASSQSEDEYGQPEGPHYQTYSPQQMATVRTNARTMITNSLIHHPISPPLLRSPDAVSFPRSGRNYRHIHRRETMESELHKKLLLARLDSLPSSAEPSIAPLASKMVAPKSQIYPNFQDDSFPTTNSVTIHSKGLRKWVLRPCYEDRARMWSCGNSGEVTCTRISGSRLGVAALEFSETLELLAGTLLESEDAAPDIQFDPTLEFSLPASAFHLDPPPIQAKKLEPWSLPPDISPSKAPPIQPSASPQPGSSPLALPEVVLSGLQLDQSKSPECAAVNEPLPKRGVRFADDHGKDDQIPLGYALRIRKNKEQKAQFLREERDRRAKEAQQEMGNRRAPVPPHEMRVPRAVAPQQRAAPQRAMASIQATSPQQPPGISQEEERLRQEAGRIEMDRLRRARDLERKQAEEQQRAYLEELQATRARREAARAGRLQSPPAQISDRGRAGSRDSMHTFLRSMSPKYAPELVLPTSPTPFDGSPASSVPVTPGSQRSLSRPPSVYSTHTASSEDVRGRDGRRVSRRLSVVADPAKQMSLQPPFDPRAYFNPYAWTNVPPVPLIPSIPAVPNVYGMPFHGMDVPLLPPSPPFMMHQYGTRPRSQTGSQPSPWQSSSSLPRHHSSDAVPQGHRSSSPHSSGFSTHQRRPSDEAAKPLGDRRSGSQSNPQTGRPSVPTRPTHLQGSSQHSGWVTPEQSRPSSMKKSSQPRPLSTASHQTPSR